jgi:hypothetical protein
MLDLEGGMSFMALKNRAEAAEEAVERLIDEENAIDSHGADSYSRTVFLAFEKIRSLRERRVSFARICRSFEISGMLPENANPHSFRQAYARERARRIKTGNDTAKKTPVSPARSSKSDSTPDAGKENARKLTGTVADTGLGKIVKHTDGSFEY